MAALDAAAETMSQRCDDDERTWHALYRMNDMSDDEREDAQRARQAHRAFNDAGRDTIAASKTLSAQIQHIRDASRASRGKGADDGTSRESGMDEQHADSILQTAPDFLMTVWEAASLVGSSAARVGCWAQDGHLLSWPSQGKGRLVSLSAVCTLVAAPPVRLSQVQASAWHSV